MGRLQVDLFGTSFTVKSGEDDAYLAELLSHYREIVSSLKASGASQDPLQLSILAGITITDEFYRARRQIPAASGSTVEQEEAEKLAMQMIAQIDGVLKS